MKIKSSVGLPRNLNFALRIRGLNAKKVSDFHLWKLSFRKIPLTSGEPLDIFEKG